MLVGYRAIDVCVRTCAVVYMWRPEDSLWYRFPPFTFFETESFYSFSLAVDNLDYNYSFIWVLGMDSNSCPHTCMASALRTEPFPVPELNTFSRLPQVINDTPTGRR